MTSFGSSSKIKNLNNQSRLFVSKTDSNKQREANYNKNLIWKLVALDKRKTAEVGINTRDHLSTGEAGRRILWGGGGRVTRFQGELEGICRFQLSIKGGGNYRKSASNWFPA